VHETLCKILKKLFKRLEKLLRILDNTCHVFQT